MIKIQSIKNRKIYTFKNQNYSIPKYNKEILIKEANLFCNWYVKYFSKSDISKFSKNFRKIIKNLINNLKFKNNIFVHRDFHVSNLMLVKNQIGVIDSQDALIGNIAYDLASLIDDVRLKTSKSFKQKILFYYLKKQKRLNIQKFKNDFEILSVLRNLKIIGIFTRLAIRDGKKDYLKLIPYAWKLIYMRINNKELFKNLKKLLDKKFKKNQMNINTALILCAGLGERLKPLTLTTPKPLLELKEITILERCINMITELGAKKILLNTFHLENKIYEFIKKKVSLLILK